MTVVAVVANILMFALVLFFIAMWARFVLDWVRVFARRWKPRGLGLVLAEASYTVTDPPIKLVRRVFPPLRVGGAALDFGWSIVMLACLFLMLVVANFS
ncbi:YggT family protein [Diaminobutyricimonas aerilata]|uniref:YggT family protein n=1 Tax=Diaminobutyricimonas aerilata TaxID=1162967 RepID=A0A2M9CKG6_9MICO|nr:YggT family protein [Diaminobutyricimonas aerilata]PJJ72380.1 YggT family protein [Diaminobutyricimonas aerilata]